MRVLYAGSGYDTQHDLLPGDAIVTRLDIDPACSPDILASMVNMGDIGEYDMVFSCHSLEHLYPQDVEKALSEFYRVLTPRGHVLVVVPDLEGVTPTTDVLFESCGGPVTGHDLFYGQRQLVDKSLYMAHHTGFVSESLENTLIAAGLSGVSVLRIPEYNLMGTGRA